ncbi:MAG: UDP-N-acetylmuramate--L-alanine ligase [Deltaproteobacteria bacterium]|nr:UDP-N-acetylmuramate--L-alanine ligase [Deltaproteobacteria bacterium]
MYKTIQKIHFVGIGGIGMSGLAEILMNLGYRVSGSDIKRTPITNRLRRRGVKVFYQHKMQNVDGAQVVVTSSAISRQNPEVLEAVRHHIPVVARAEILAELMRLKYGVAVAGTHGKTTTTSLIAAVLEEGGFDPTVVVGGRVRSLRSNARLGKGEFLVAEADESDGSFLKLSPTIAVVTTIDPEHMDYYRDFAKVKRTFAEFCAKVPFYGLVVWGIDHPVVRTLAHQFQKRSLTYSLGGKIAADLTATHLTHKENQSEALIHFHGKKLGRLKLQIPGRHNVSNALAAIAVGLELGIPYTKIARALRRFKGISRRMEILYQDKNTLVMDDYGHHPEEIKATLRAVKEGWGRKTIVIFQPHRYSRTRDLFDSFRTAFGLADQVILTDIYAASEEPIRGITGERLARAIKNPNVLYEPDFGKIIDLTKQRVGAYGHTPRLILTLGAGDIWKVGREIARQLEH